MYEIEFSVVNEPKNGNDLPRFVERLAYPDDACLDLYANVNVEIEAGKTVVVPTNLKIKRHNLPANTFMKIFERSSLSMNGVFVHGGVIDRSYRGELKIILHNSTETTHTIYPRDRIAQMCVLHTVPVKFKKYTEGKISLLASWGRWLFSLWQSYTTREEGNHRGETGFGSSSHKIL